jgi:hypothetical protein
MNNSHFLLKIISKPEKVSFDNDIIHAECIGQFYQFRSNKHTVCKISSWGDVAVHILRYYKINDFILIQGYLRSQKTNFEELNITTAVEISACTAFPYALKNRPKEIKK